MGRRQLALSHRNIILERQRRPISGVSVRTLESSWALDLSADGHYKSILLTLAGNCPVAAANVRERADVAVADRKTA